jgi:hypothetical protein
MHGSQAAMVSLKPSILKKTRALVENGGSVENTFELFTDANTSLPIRNLPSGAPYYQKRACD